MISSPSSSLQRDSHSRLNPFELPEFIHLIHSYLHDDIPTILSCCLVSKSFREYFLPLLWKKLNLPYRYRSRLPSLDLVQANADLVRSVSLIRYGQDMHWVPIPQPPMVPFPQLKSLLIWDKDRQNNGPGFHDWIYYLNMVLPDLMDCLQETLHELTLEVEVGGCMNFLRKVTQLHGLRYLHLVDMSFVGLEQNRMFWRLCSLPTLVGLQVRKIKLKDSGNAVALEQERRLGEFNSRVHLPFKLQEVDFHNIRCDSLAFGQLIWIVKNSPSLKSLESHFFPDYWTKKQFTLPSWIDEPLHSPQQPSLWPNLSRLDLRDSRNMDDSQLGIFLDSVTCGLKELNLESTRFGPTAFRSLMMDQHTRTLTRLDVRSCRGVSSGMLSLILRCCGRLVSILGTTLLANDLFMSVSQLNRRGIEVSTELYSSTKTKTAEEPLILEPWACQDLEEWSLDLKVNVWDLNLVEKMEELIFTRLVGLKRLSVVHMLYRRTTIQKRLDLTKIRNREYTFQ